MEIHDYSTGEMPDPGEDSWTTAELTEQFTVHAFAAPYVIVTRKSDGQRGTLQFNHSPRVYFGWCPDA